MELPAPLPVRLFVGKRFHALVVPFLGPADELLRRGWRTLRRRFLLRRLRGGQEEDEQHVSHAANAPEHGEQEKEETHERDIDVEIRGQPVAHAGAHCPMGNLVEPANRWDRL